MGGEPAWLGWRMVFRPAMARALLDRSLNGFWQTAEELRQPVSFLAPQMTPLFHAIAARYPCLPRIADHMGVVPEDAAAGNLALRVAELAELARYSDVSVTLLLLTMFSRQACPWRVMDDHIRRHLGAFGPERCHWGTDITNYPTRTVMFSSMPERVTHVTEELPFLSEAAKDWIMGRSILRKWNGC